MNCATAPLSSKEHAPSDDSGQTKSNEADFDVKNSNADQALHEGRYKESISISKELLEEICEEKTLSTFETYPHFMNSIARIVNISKKLMSSTAEPLNIIGDTLDKYVNDVLNNHPKPFGQSGPNYRYREFYQKAEPYIVELLSHSDTQERTAKWFKRSNIVISMIIVTVVFGYCLVQTFK